MLLFYFYCMCQVRSVTESRYCCKFAQKRACFSICSFYALHKYAILQAMPHAIQPVVQWFVVSTLVLFP